MGTWRHGHIFQILIIFVVVLLGKMKRYFVGNCVFFETIANQVHVVKRLYIDFRFSDVPIDVLKIYN
jgi:hypothetical protein